MATPSYVTLANNNQYNQTTTGATYASFNVATDISPGDGTAGFDYQTQPAQLYPGQMLRFTAAGVFSTTVSPNLTLGLYYGTVSGAVLAATDPIATISGAANANWYLTAVARVLDVGATGHISTIGFVSGISSATGSIAPLPKQPVIAGVAIDTTAAKMITVGATYSASSASNSITCLHWAIEYLTEP